MSKVDGGGWASDPIHAAGGRRHYNSVRQQRAKLRRIEILRIIDESGMSFVTWGVQRMLAARLGVSESTISRDLNGILAPGVDPKRCPFCHSRPLSLQAAEAIEEARLRLEFYLHG
jgi:hypothetical protein